LITVDAGIVAVSGINLDKSSDAVALQHTTQLNATVVPDNASNKAVLWTSSNETIATVSTSGLVMVYPQEKPLSL
jgi:uncharacterized protein YjdB